MPQQLVELGCCCALQTRGTRAYLACAFQPRGVGHARWPFVFVWLVGCFVPGGTNEHLTTAPQSAILPRPPRRFRYMIKGKSA